MLAPRILYMHSAECDCQCADLTSVSCCRDLNRNRLSEIDSLVFSGLSGLQVLKLKRNGIKRLMDGAFYHLLNMTRL